MGRSEGRLICRRGHIRGDRRSGRLPEGGQATAVQHVLDDRAQNRRLENIERLVGLAERAG
jgi:hypothetical protein